MTTTEDVAITPAMAIAELVKGLRAIPDDWTNIGHASGDPSIRKAAAKKMVAWGKQTADRLESMTTDNACLFVGGAMTDLYNLDPLGDHIGKWASVATTNRVRPGYYFIRNNALSKRLV